MNKPHGMAVQVSHYSTYRVFMFLEVVKTDRPFALKQGGTGIKTSIDELAAVCLKFDTSESPRLVSLEMSLNVTLD